jgi:hypothetical protein
LNETYQNCFNIKEREERRGNVMTIGRKTKGMGKECRKKCREHRTGKRRGINSDDFYVKGDGGRKRRRLTV